LHWLSYLPAIALVVLDIADALFIGIYDGPGQTSTRLGPSLFSYTAILP
jgi:hypothetical protein